MNLKNSSENLDYRTTYSYWETKVTFSPILKTVVVLFSAPFGRGCP
jgi:hypothetical protein